jgi:hypothetical protein
MGVEKLEASSYNSSLMSRSHHTNFTAPANSRRQFRGMSGLKLQRILTNKIKVLITSIKAY